MRNINNSCQAKNEEKESYIGLAGCKIDLDKI
jgi:hypothetical protein